MTTRNKFNCFLWGIIFSCILFWSWFHLDGVGCFSADNRYRSQTEALLDGHFALSTSPAGLEHDFTWSQEGGVHQVWGLGIPFLRLPFEAIARLLGFSAFPDRLLLLFWLLCTGYLCYRVVVRCKQSNTPISHGATWTISLSRFIGFLILLFFPTLIALLSSRMAIYEEALVYTYLYGIAEALILLCFIRDPRMESWLILCAMAGLGAFIRPTLVFYGLSSVLVGLVFFLIQSTQARTQNFFLNFRGMCNYTWLWGVILFLAGGGLLFVSNQQRFDDGFEFGHKLNLQEGDPMLGSMYSTRFGCPYESEPIFSACKELFGILFLPTKFNNGNWYEHDLFPGQSKTFRWRDTYLRTYDLSVLFFLVSSIIVTGITFTHRRLKKQKKTVDYFATSLPSNEVFFMVLWGILAFIPLVYFYLWSPVISSRYMFDFAPAFAIIIFSFNLYLSERCLKASSRILISILFLCWLILEIFISVNPKWKEEIKNGLTYKGVKYIVDTSSPIKILHSSFDCIGWNKKTGSVSVLTTVFVNNAKYLELELEPNDSLIESMHQKGETNFPAPNPEVIRAKIGVEYLERESIIPTEHGWKIRFRGPQKKVYQSGYQVAFIALIAKEDLGYMNSPWLLKSVRWNSTDKPKTILEPASESKTSKIAAPDKSE